MLPVINRSVRDARNYKLVITTSAIILATVATTGATSITPPVTSNVVQRAPRLDIRQRSERTNQAGHDFSDIRQYFPGIADTAT
jgi:hypothetical protein